MVRSLVAKMTVVPLAVATLLLAAAGPALAAENTTKPKKARPQQVHPTGAEDAKAPTPAELSAEDALDQMLSRSTEGLEVVTHADGTISVDLEGRFMNVSVANPGPDGKPRVNCVSSHDGLAKSKQAAADPKPVSKPAPVLEEK